MLTGQGDDVVEVEASCAGAFDYLRKDELTPTLLEHTIRSVRARFEAEQQERQRARRLRQAPPEAPLEGAAGPERSAGHLDTDLEPVLSAVLDFVESVRDQRLGPLGTDAYVGAAAAACGQGRLLRLLIENLLRSDGIGSGGGPGPKPG